MSATLKFLILCSYFLNAYTFDFFEESQKLVDHSVSPCEDFYRHACPLGSPDFLDIHIVGEKFEEYLAQNKIDDDGIIPVHETFQIDEDLKMDSLNFTNNTSENIINIFKAICESGQDTSVFLKNVENILFPNEECALQLCFTHLSKDPQCDRVVEYMQEVVPIFEEINTTDAQKYMSIINTLVGVINKLEKLNNFMEQSGTTEINNLFLEMKDEISRLIQRTPWAQNHNVTELIENAVKPLYLENYMEKTRNEILKVLRKLNQKYSECKNEYTIPNSALMTEFCFILSSNWFDDEDFHTPKFDLKRAVKGYFYDAWTIYPQISIGYVWYYMYMHSNSRAAQIGSTGFIMAHELSHALIKSHKADILTYFSASAKECIQQQYKSSCKEFDEGNCVIGDDRFEENGADVLGLEITYLLFEKRFLDKRYKGEVQDFAGSKHLQHMFYAAATALCSGRKQVNYPIDPHSPSNVRINSMVNHPAFQKAFQCADDTRMMRSKTDQCSVYGYNAPAHRRRLVAGMM